MNNKFLIVGNWKMNTSLLSAKDLIFSLCQKMKNINKSDLVEVVISPPFTHLYEAKNLIGKTEIFLSAQNCHFEESGAFTGEISPKTLSEMGVSYVILGHSERRNIFLESDELINKKVKSAIKYNMKPIICVGETLEQRKNLETEEVLKNQIKKALDGVEDIKNVIIAYEPIWAIGTGETASPEIAENNIFFIRNFIKELYGETKSNNLIILYGGSLNENNAFELLSKKNINGGLIGGASLKAESFFEIILKANEIVRGV